jgi:hypothetical protein
MATELYQFNITGSHNGMFWENVLFFRGDNLTADDVIPNAQDLIDSWIANIHTAFLAMLPSSCWVNRYIARRVVPSGGINIVQQYDPFTEVGTVVGAASSNQLCPIVRLIPPMGTKSAGRFFLAAIAESDIDNNAPVAGWLTRLGTLMVALMTDFGSGTIQWQSAVYSRKLGTYALTMDYDTSPIIGWQLRRSKPF